MTAMTRDDKGLPGMTVRTRMTAITRGDWDDCGYLRRLQMTRDD